MIKKKDTLLNIRNSFCGVGIKSIKKLLSSLSEEDNIAEILKLVLDIEDINIKAKIKSKNTTNRYLRKEDLIHKLTVLVEKNNLNYGFSKSDILGANSIVYFDLPIGQVSWHSMLDFNKYKRYNGKWDGKYFSTLTKLEKYIINNYINK